MALPTPAATNPPKLEPGSLLLPPALRLTPEQFERVCQANPEAVLALEAFGRLFVMTPTGGKTSSRNREFLFQLRDFRGRHHQWRMFDSS